MSAGGGLLEGSVALITGASRGIGAAVAKAYAAEGAQLVLLARTVGALEELDDELRRAGGRKPLLVPHDLLQLDALDPLGAELYRRYGRLDILVGNAAMLGVLSPTGHVPPATWADVMAVNLTANYRLLRSLDPLLTRADAGRAVFVTDRVAADRPAYWGPYAASKAALEALVQSYAAEKSKTRIRANLIRPYPTRTALRAQAFPGEDPNRLPRPESLGDSFLALAAKDLNDNGNCLEPTLPKTYKES